MKRYTTTRRKIDKSGKRVYSTTYYPEIPIGNSDTFIFNKVTGEVRYVNEKKYYIVKDMTK